MRNALLCLGIAVGLAIGIGASRKGQVAVRAGR